jgi:multimeric flavodoxin WrbA
MEIEKMKALIINCSPVRTGATAEIAKLVSEQLSAKFSVKSICIDDYSFSFCKG